MVSLSPDSPAAEKLKLWECGLIAHHLSWDQVIKELGLGLTFVPQAIVLLSEALA